MTPPLHPRWLEYKHQRNRCLLICLGGIPAAAAIGLVLPSIAPLAITAWFVASIWFSMKLSYFKCPRCEKPFIISKTRGYNGFTQKCLNCGLPKWSDPAQ